MAKILDGNATREALLPPLATKIKTLYRVPTLAIIQVGGRPDSEAFIRAKKSFAARIGVKERHLQLSEKISQADLVRVIEEQNSDESIQGIIVQLPLPLHIDRDVIIDSINPSKDADGLTSYNVKRWLEGREDAVMPATARGIRELLKHASVDLYSKKVTVIGRSMLVGKPIAAMCLSENATVTICHSKTANLSEETRKADILIVAAGSPGLIGPACVREGQVIIDVGISRGANGSLVGDVDFESVKNIVAAISPVPGGVGPMTVFSLFENLVHLSR